MMVRLKGQVAFESLFILLVIMTAAIYISNLYLQVHEATAAGAAARDELFAQTIDMNTSVVLRHVHFGRSAQTGATILVVETDPKTLGPSDFDWIPVKERLAKISDLTNFSVTVNGTPKQIS